MKLKRFALNHVIYFTVEPKDLRRQLRPHLPPGNLGSTRSTVPTQNWQTSLR
jgi:hypothetical protein